MKEKILNLLSQPSTWRGLVMSLGGILSLISDYINPKLITLIIPVVMFIVGMIGTLTDDYKNTNNKLDDILNAASKGIEGKND